MPNVNQGGGVSLTFSQKNSDVKDIIENHKKKLGKKFKATDYICECIRFYEDHKSKKVKNQKSGLNEKQMRKIISEELEKALSNIKVLEKEEDKSCSPFDELESGELFFADSEEV